jgi:endosialidase-like protein
VAPTDVIGAQQQSLNQQNVGYNAQVGQNNALMSGLFGLGSAGLGGWAYGGFKGSDRRTKTDIKKVGQLDNGQPVYKYRYKNGGLMELGLMAQDVKEDIPEAVVTTPSGLMAVDYDRATEAA